MRVSPRLLIRQAMVDRLREAADTWPQEWPDTLGGWPWQGKAVNVFSGRQTWRDDTDVPDIAVMTPSDTVTEEAPLTPAALALAASDKVRLESWVTRTARVDVQAMLQLKDSPLLHDHADQFAQAISDALDGWTPTGDAMKGYSGATFPLLPAEITLNTEAQIADGGLVAMVVVGFDVIYHVERRGWTPGDDVEICVEGYDDSQFTVKQLGVSESSTILVEGGPTD